MLFELTMQHRGSTTRLVCAGDLSAKAAKELDDAVDLALDTEPLELSLDTTGVTRVGFGGLLSLLRAARRCEQESADFSLDAGPRVADALDIAGLWWLGLSHPAGGFSQEVENWLHRHAFLELGEHLYLDPAEGATHSRSATGESGTS